MHSISVAICKQSQNIENILSKNNFSFFSKNGYLVIAAQKGIRTTLKKENNQVVFAYTDYFGGCGYQSARLINLKNNKEQRFKSINKALQELGVEKDKVSTDEFDFVGLTKIRTNDDISPDQNSQQNKKTVYDLSTEEHVQLLLDNGWIKTEKCLTHNQLGVIPLNNEFFDQFVKTECIKMTLEQDNKNYEHYFLNPLQDNGYQVKSFYPLILIDSNGQHIIGEAANFIKNKFVNS